ncbi:MAG: hypothetical protein ACR2HS_06945, partial [Gammaproteobacteria bacterium]
TRYLNAFNKSYEIQKKLDLFFQKKHLNLSEFKCLANDFIEQIKLINRYSPNNSEIDVRDKFIIDLLHRSALFLDMNEPKEKLATIDQNNDSLDIITTTTIVANIKKSEKQKLIELQENINKKYNQLIKNKNLESQELDNVIKQYQLSTDLKQLQWQTLILSSSFDVSADTTIHDILNIIDTEIAEIISNIPDLLALFIDKCLSGSISDVKKIFTNIHKNLNLEYLLDKMPKILNSNAKEENLKEVFMFLLDKMHALKISINLNHRNKTEYFMSICEIDGVQLNVSTIVALFFNKKTKLSLALINYQLNSANSIGLIYLNEIIPVVKVIAMIVSTPGLKYPATEFTSIMRSLILTSTDLMANNRKIYEENVTDHNASIISVSSSQFLKKIISQ